MSIEKELHTRSESKCELCAATEDLKIVIVAPATEEKIDHCILACSTCINQMEDGATMDANHWRCLNDSMWSNVPAVQVVAWRMLNRLKAEGWPQDLLDMLYLDEDTKKWAESTGEGIDEEDKIRHIDSNGAILSNGDTVTLIKDLDVKGATFTAKRGTAVRNIMLVADNAEHIEGNVSGQRIVILTKFVKKN